MLHHPPERLPAVRMPARLRPTSRLVLSWLLAPLITLLVGPAGSAGAGAGEVAYKGWSCLSGAAIPAPVQTSVPPPIPSVVHTVAPSRQIPPPSPTPQTTPTPTPPPTPLTSPTPTTPPILLTDSVADPHQPGVQWFAPTGHTLRGSFLDYWQKNGGLAQFGYPITEEFFEPDGPNNAPLQVQYFERNRFEHHPENAGTQYEVLLGRLGADFHSPDPPASSLPNAHYFPETGHNLGGAFLHYWQTHGGLAIHGYPITEQFTEINPIDQKPYTVQYFERSRMEYHPENAGTPFEVLLGLLGTQLGQQQGYFSGAYPRYGHAADFSWIAGKIDVYAGPCISFPECGCALFRYEETGTHLQLGPLVRVGRALAALQSKRESYIVAFGHPAGPGEDAGTCDTDPNAQGYIVTQMQVNQVVK
jgi:hypothetical protein